MMIFGGSKLLKDFLGCGFSMSQLVNCKPTFLKEGLTIKIHKYFLSVLELFRHWEYFTPGLFIKEYLIYISLTSLLFTLKFHILYLAVHLLLFKKKCFYFWDYIYCSWWQKTTTLPTNRNSSSFLWQNVVVELLSLTIRRVIFQLLFQNCKHFRGVLTWPCDFIQYQYQKST